MIIPLPETSLWQAARRVAGALRAAGYPALIVGGAVRYLLLGSPVDDIDLGTEASLETVLAMFPGAKAVGHAFQVAIVPGGGYRFEVASFREEGPYEDGRHPSSVRLSDWNGDSCRRDFTVNALALDPETGQVLDPHGGLADLKDKVLRCVGDPKVRFEEDALRILRLYRFAASLGFSPDPAAEHAALGACPLLSRLPRERVLLEIQKIRPGCFAAFANALFSQPPSRALLPSFPLEHPLEWTYSPGFHVLFPGAALGVCAGGGFLRSWPLAREDRRVLALATPAQGSFWEALRSTTRALLRAPSSLGAQDALALLAARRGARTLVHALQGACVDPAQGAAAWTQSLVGRPTPAQGAWLSRHPGLGVSSWLAPVRLARRLGQDSPLPEVPGLAELLALEEPEGGEKSTPGMPPGDGPLG